MGRILQKIGTLFAVFAGIGAGADTPYGIAELERALIEHEPRSISDLLPTLPNKLLTNYVLMTKSRSAQGASEANPRVLLYGDGSLVLAFNGDPAHRGYEQLEIIEYKKSRGEYEFRVVDFSTGQAKMSPPNPSRCTLCHQNPLRPNWEPYPFWPGAVGENSTITETDLTYLKEFSSRGAVHPRYRHLKRRENLAAIEAQILKFTPAMHLNTAFSQQRSRRVAMSCRRTPEYRKFRWAVMASLLDCPDIPSFLPEGTLPGGKWEWQRLYDDLEKKKTAVPAPHRRLLNDIDLRIVANLRYLFESRSLSIRPWFYSLTQPYLFTTVSLVEARGAVTQLTNEDPELKAISLPSSAIHRHLSRRGFPSLYTAKEQKEMQTLCTGLRFKSLTAFFD